jgi:hypothetical protein
MCPSLPAAMSDFGRLSLYQLCTRALVTSSPSCLSSLNRSSIGVRRRDYFSAPKHRRVV